MENGSATSPKGSAGAHRSTDHLANGHVQPEGGSSAPAGTGHKRSLSGSILSKLAFLRTSFEELPSLPSISKTRDAERNNTERDAPSTTKRGGAMATAMSEDKVRRRKDSLRKAAMLGTGKLRERSDAPRKSPPRSLHASTDHQRNIPGSSPTTPEDRTPRRRFSYENPSAASSAEGGITLFAPAPKHSHHAAGSISPRDSPQSAETHAPVRPILASPVAISPNAHPYVSTTDESDSSPYRHHDPSAATTAPTTTTAGTANATIPPRRRSKPSTSARATSPLSQSVLLPLPTPSSDEDNAETERYGWLLLLCTWLIFVVGMGSCLGVWSWAWDVGETPYAPPELEDDPTLPIVGYYPALIVMTGVMAWVWVVVAWVGMKYFRHAKVVGEEG
ncbi:hypothetical protein W97_04134 [Coniosporium apollinis CBS 100218]|uniref:Uncharacterized protein n=1 Tax=Coniosporium apollinis (strain CBS 100218) TaxID=1168221 RepID=R7YSL7_CONA1|nr:uncharacterized protein W97_04134 [Coniosporium apollinis CBS 100218]EON64900.1 hypothetical protein W97_04134 [Coniosporium apollinis CBS 100218]